MDRITPLESLDTAFVSLAGLIRYLREQNFSGRVHVALEDYDADVFIYPDGSPSVWEIDRLTGLSARGDGAFERLMVRSREPGGRITIYSANFEEDHATVSEGENDIRASQIGSKSEALLEEEIGWEGLLASSGELLAAVERAALVESANFSAQLQAVRIQLGDDYPFLDPTVGEFQYEQGQVRLNSRPAVATYVTSLVECLRRITNHLAAGAHGDRFRERVAAELALAARREAVPGFVHYLDRIAGTRVI
jgi:hypothetical protein